MEQSPLFRLPGELRNDIYQLVASTTGNLEFFQGHPFKPLNKPTYARHALDLSQSCRQIRRESMPFLLARPVDLTVRLDSYQLLDGVDEYGHDIASWFEEWHSELGAHWKNYCQDLNITIELPYSKRIVQDLIMLLPTFQRWISDEYKLQPAFKLRFTKGREQRHLNMWPIDINLHASDIAAAAEYTMETCYALYDRLFPPEQEIAFPSSEDESSGWLRRIKYYTTMRRSLQDLVRALDRRPDWHWTGMQNEDNGARGGGAGTSPNDASASTSTSTRDMLWAVVQVLL
ncbi:hypothetical protein Slin14017_G095810 [Septoria linicola]|nr:hypothetical protein Slin14017_G095810 [Septoria linicola]